MKPRTFVWASLLLAAHVSAVAAAPQRVAIAGINNFWRVDDTISTGGTITSREMAVPELKRRGIRTVINLAGGADDVYGNINVPAGGRISVGGSTQANFFGNITQNGIVSIAPGSTASFFGNVSGTGTFALAGSAEFLGAISPGNSPGVMNVTGSATLYNTATLQIELAGIALGTQYDQLNASGPFALSGILTVSLIGGFTPAAGNSFDILNWGSRIGTFSAIQLPALASGLHWDTTQLYSTGVLSVTASGDFNNDGRTNAADYVTWRKTDGTQNGYAAWRENFSLSSSSAESLRDASAAPEPAALILVLITLALSTLSRPRR